VQQSPQQTKPVVAITKAETTVPAAAPPKAAMSPPKAPANVAQVVSSPPSPVVTVKNPRMQLNSEEDDNDLTFKGVIKFLTSYKPVAGCAASLLQRREDVGLEALSEIVSGCETWLQSFKSFQPNPHKLSDDELMAIGLYTFDLG